MRIALLTALALVAGCKDKDKSTAAEPATEVRPVAPPVGADVAKKGTLKRAPVAFFAVIVPKDTDVTKLEATAKQLAEKRGFRVVTKPEKGTAIVIDRTTPAQVGLKAGEPLGEFVPESERAGVEASTVALGIVGSADGGGPKLAHDTALVAKEIAEACKGWVMDLDLRLLHKPSTLMAHVPTPIGADVRETVMLHGVAGENDLGQIDTAGMARLGLPEIQIRDVPPAYIKNVSFLANLTAQTLVERGDLTRDGQLVVDANALPADWEGASLKAAGGTGVITWEVRWAKSDHSDEPLLELAVPGAKPGSAEALMAAIDTFSGKTADDVHTFDYQDELDAAAVQARAALVKLKPRFAKGIPPSELLAVKAPFTTDDGRIEWMWVDVVAFKGDMVDGVLDNTPQAISKLKSGQRVQVKFGDLADFIHTQADGKRVGGYSLEVMRKHGEDIPPL